MVEKRAKKILLGTQHPNKTGTPQISLEIKKNVDVLIETQKISGCVFDAEGKTENMNEILRSFVLDIIMKKKLTMPMKEIYMSFLECLNEDFDDDLLLDALNLLEG